MKRLISFDAYAGAYDVVDALYPIRALAGVRSVEVLSALEGSPKFCVIVDVDDASQTLLTDFLFDQLHSALPKAPPKRVGPKPVAA